MLKKEEYLKTVKRPYPPLFCSLVCTGYSDEKQFDGFLQEPFHMENMAHVDSVWYYGKKELDIGGRLALASWRNKKLFKYVIKEIKRRENNLVKAATTNFENFCRVYQEYMPVLLLIFAIEKPTETALRIALAKKLPAQEVDELMYQLNIPLQDNYHKQEEHDLVTSADIATHIKKYRWLSARYGEEKEYTLEEAKEKLKKIDKKEFLKKWENEKKELRRIISRAKKKLDVDSDLVDIFQYMIYYRTHRTDTMNKSAFLAIPMLKEKALSVGVSYEQLLRCSAEEILKNKIPSKNVLDSRIKDCSTILEGKNVRCETGETSQKIIQFFQENIWAVNEFKGNIACKGRAVGVVKIVSSGHDFNKIQEGNILVTSMTTPEMVPIMKKAAAFITDEGGVTCHAAIVSREMNKPCIIGTKNATQLLKNGDMVEVDADKGIVKIL
jgi:phosphohistidine swiveling domain-containing protein